MKNDDKTDHRVKNLIIDPNDPWGMWCIVCIKWAAQCSSIYLSNFVKDLKNFQPRHCKKESVDIHFKSISHSQCFKKEKSTFIPSKDAAIYKKIP